jgi:signal peptidase I
MRPPCATALRAALAPVARTPTSVYDRRSVDDPAVRPDATMPDLETHGDRATGIPLGTDFPEEIHLPLRIAYLVEDDDAAQGSTSGVTFARRRGALLAPGLVLRLMLSWAVAAARVAAFLLLVLLAGLAATALAPQAVGLEAHVVVSGSMTPHVHPGDVVLTAPVSAAELRPGQVVLFPDPQEPDRLLLHRLVSVDPHGRLVTRGDANQSDDGVHVPPSEVRGVARLRVPLVGLPALWRQQGALGHLALAAVLCAGAALFVSRGPGPEDPAKGMPPVRR